MRVSLLFLAAGLLPLAAASSQAQAPKSMNVCEILTRADVESLIGEKLQRNPRESGNDIMNVRSDTCNYRSPGWVIRANIERGRDAGGAKEYMDTFRKTTGKASGAKAVSGLGDDAWWTTTTESKSGMLVVKRRNDVLTVSTSGSGAGAASLEKTQELMKKLLAAYEKAPK